MWQRCALFSIGTVSVSAASEALCSDGRQKGEILPCIVVKLGGSAITIKAQLETLKEETLEATVQHIAAASRSGVRLAVLHGAGSFGHFQAKRYGISNGNGHLQWALGFADTRRAVTRLNHEASFGGFSRFHSWLLTAIAWFILGLSCGDLERHGCPIPSQTTDS